MGTGHLADHSANHIKMLSIHLDPRAARELDRYPGCSRDHRRKCRNHCDLPEDTRPRRYTPTQDRLPELLAPMVERSNGDPFPATEPRHRELGAREPLESLAPLGVFSDI